MQISVRADTKKLTKSLSRTQKKQIPFATVLALTNTGAIAADRLRGELKAKLSKTSRYTLNAPFATMAKKTNPRTIVGYKDKQERYLAPNVYGGVRPETRFEYLLKQKGIIGYNEFVYPGRGAKITKGVYQKILSGLRAQGDYHQNSPRGSRAGGAYHVGYRGNIKGIWETGKPFPALIFAIVKTKPAYRKVLQPFDTIRKSVSKYYPRQFNRALKRALATAK